MKTPAFRTILCPSDLATVGDGAMAVAFALAPSGGTVHLLHVWEPGYVLSPLDAVPVIALPSNPAADEAHDAKVRSHLEKLVPAAAASRGVKHEIHVVKESDAAGTIAREAKRLGVDAIVLGTHGRSGLGKVLMGSVATDLLKTTKARVILVRDPVEK